MNKKDPGVTGLEVAVIGMACCFPGAKNCDEFWENLQNGIETVSFFSDPELEEAGQDLETLRNPNYVKANNLLAEIEYFDAAFFDCTPREAELLNPQVRIFLQCAWHALEDAGYDPGAYDGTIGLYAGTSSSFYWEALALLSGKSAELGAFAAENLTNKDHLCTQISYKLGLKGPACLVQTACSTSLVAIHWASRAVLSAECRMALAGGVTAAVTQKNGYLYTEGMILSPDGHNRTFDARARGTVGGSGAGVVVLKRLKNALADGDHIYALVKGSAINNDGKRKVGFTAPSVAGQAEVIRTALAMARVQPESIGYVEAHGTGTTLGDPVEIEALTLAFALPKRSFCAIGSVKSNLGHLDSAAGVSGFIKAVLALKNRLIPPSLHFETPNPGIDFENSPFYVNTRLTKWESETGPLRAGVSSFGIGGTNAHVILEEAPPPIQRTGQTPSRLILLSAATPSVLEQMTKNLAGFLKKNPGLSLADVAYTLQVGRKPLQFRRIARGATVEQALDSLSPGTAGNLPVSRARDENRLVFMFPGQGAQYVDMGLELYRSQPLFRQEIHRCSEILKPLLGHDIKEILYPGRSDPSDTSDKSDLHRTEITQPLLFSFEYALARLLLEWGLEPHAMIGHSIGEYTAACLAGVFSLEEALTLVALRGRLMQVLPPGSMLGVPLAEAALKTLLTGHRELDLAAVNSSSHGVVSGPTPAVAAFARQLTEKGYKTRDLHTSHAFHSRMMDPVLPVFAEKVRKTRRGKPKIPFISNLSGDWITDSQAAAPGYWAAHLRETVRFAAGLDTLLKEKNCLFIEVGPGNTLSTFARKHRSGEANPGPAPLALNLVRHPQENIPDQDYLVEQVGRLWLRGVQIPWNRFYHGEIRQRTPLPLYPFDKRRYWLDGTPSKTGPGTLRPTGELGRKQDMADWFYIPSWKKTAPPLRADTPAWLKEKQTWLVFPDETGLGAGIAGKLRQSGHEITTVVKGTGFSQRSEREYTIDTCEAADYHSLVEDLVKKNREPKIILHLWSVNPGTGGEDGSEAFRELQYPGYYSLIFLTQALERQGLVYTGTMPAAGAGILRVMVVTHRVQAVTEEEEISPAKTTVLGPCKTLPLEYRNVRCRTIDTQIPGGQSRPDPGQLDRLTAELLSDSADEVVALRGKTRWVQYLQPVRLDRHGGTPVKLRERGIYLVTGGLGKDSLVRARYLAKTVKARLILTGRSRFPPAREWEQWLASHGPQDPISEKIKQLQEIETLGGEVVILQADVADPHQMNAVMTAIAEKYAALNGVIHAAGITTVESSILISRLDRGQSELHFQPKVHGLYTLEKLLKGRDLDFCLLTSSLASFLAGGGVTAYTAANIFMDAFVHHHNRGNTTQWLSLNWVGVSPRETAEAFHRLLNLDSIPQVVVFDYDFDSWLERRRNQLTGQEESRVSPTRSELLQRRPETLGLYTAPAKELEKNLVRLWESFFGLQPLGINDNFFELGGNSLDAITLIAKIHRQSQVELSLADFFRSPTIKELAAHLEKFAGKSTFTPLEPAEEKDYYTASSIQKRLYFLQQMYRESTVYNIVEIIPLPEQVHLRKLEQIFQQLIRRHESLRTSFHMVGQTPVQKVHREVAFAIEPDDPAADNDIRPFDLSRAPLLRVRSIRTASPAGARENNSRGIRILLLDLHHIISDRTSQQILQQEFISLYQGEELPSLKLRYRDYTEWQCSRTQKKNLRQQEAYWLTEFSGEIPVLHLPGDYPRPSLQHFAGNLLTFTTDPAATRKLKELARDVGATSYMVLLALLYTLMAKISGQEDIVIGTTAAGRRHAELENLVGMFVNTLAIRNYPCGGKSFHRFLIEVKQKALGAFENQDYSFEDLVERTGVNRDAGRNPLFDVLFDFHSTRENTPLEENSAPDPEPASENHPFGSAVAKFDLTWIGMEEGESISWQLIYCTALFTPETLRRWLRYLNNLLLSVLENPGIKLSQIDIIPPEEKQETLYRFNQTTLDYPREKILPQLFEEQVEKIPAYTAINVEHRFLTYREFQRRVRQVAIILKEKGVKPDTLVAIMAERSLETVIGIFAILTAGGAYFPLDPHYPDERIKFLLQDSGTQILLIDDSSCPACPSWFVSAPQALLNLSAGPPFLFPSSPLPHFPAPPPSSLAYILYTSGSTGRPKGVMIQHSALVNFLSGFQELYPPRESDRYLMKTPFSFDVSVVELFAWIPGGNSVVILKKGGEKDPAAITNTLAAARITHIQFVPSLFNALVNSLSRPDMDRLSGLRYIFLAGEELLALSITRFNDKEPAPGICLENLYGPTETTVYTSRYSLSAWDGKGKIPIGKPLPNVKVYILDRQGCLQPLGTAGELYAAGPGVARGYLNRPELTAQRFCLSRSYINKKFFRGGPGGAVFLKSAPPGRRRQKLYKTGDLARWLPDGDLEFLGRLDNQVKIRGFRIELGEIENQLLKIETIKEAAVLPQGTKNTFLCAYVVAAGDLDITEVKKSLSCELPEYMVPLHVVPMEKIPLTPSGKIDKNALPQAETGSMDTYTPPQDRMEKRLCRIWSETLGIAAEKISTTANFFQLGGNSLALITVVSKIYREFGTELSITQVYENPTIHQAAKRIKAKDFSESPVVRLNQNKIPQPAGTIFCFPPQIAYGVFYLELAALLNDYAWYAFSFLEEADRLEKYVDIITRLQPQGPYIFFGYSAAGPLAFETAKALEKRGGKIAAIIFMDCFFQENMVLDDDYYQFHYQAIGEIIEEMGLAFLKEKVIQKSLNYMKYCASRHSLEEIHADVHLVLSEMGQRLNWSGECWKKLTRGSVITHNGFGHHREVFAPANIRKNGEILRQILGKIK